MREKFTVSLFVFLIVLGALIFFVSNSVYAQNGFNIVAQNTLQVGESIYLTGTICPNPDNAFSFIVTVNYTSSSGQVFSKNVQVGYGTVSLCNSSFVIDPKTYFNRTGSWQVQAKAEWVDSNDVAHTLYSNVFNFTVVQQVTTSTTSSTSTSQNSSSTSTKTTSTTTTSSLSTSETSSQQCGFISGICVQNIPSNGLAYFENITLGQNSAASIQFNITSPSYLGYFAVSNPGPVEEAVFSLDQYDSFLQYGSATGVSICNGSIASFSGSCGKSLLNGLLILPGEYYLTVYSPDRLNQVYFGYNASYTLRVVNSTTYVGSFINPSGTFVSDSFLIHSVTLGSPSVLKLFGISTTPVRYLVVDLLHNESLVFESNYLTTTNLNGTMPKNTVEPFYLISLPAGFYKLIIEGEQQVNTEVYFEYQIIPAYVDPYYIILLSRLGIIPQSSSQPMGVASFGIYNDSKRITPYQESINTSAIAGATLINNITVSNDSIQTPPYNATNQLNAVLVVTDNTGQSYAYWTQNVMKFDTKDKVLLFADDIFNFTGSGAELTNSSVTSSSGGFVSGGSYEIHNNLNYYLHGYKSYTLPLSYVLVMTETVIPGTGVLVNMTDNIIQGMAKTGPITFDSILIHDANIKNAFFYVSGNEYTPAGLEGFHLFYDAENIFGGGGGGSAASFSALDAKVNLAYFNETTGNYTFFPSAYSFGADTAETAVKVHATYLGNGAVGLSIGKENWDYIYPSTQVNQTTTQSQTTQGQTTQSQETSSNGKTSQVLQTGSNHLIEELAVASVAAASAIAGLMTLLKRRRQVPPPPPP